MSPQRPASSILDEESFDLEVAMIRDFATATRAADPVHTDLAAARDAAFATIPATPTHVVVAGHYRDQQAFVTALGMDITRVVVGSVEWEYHRPLVAGDRITGTRRIVDDVTRTGKRGGTMRLVTLETAWIDSDGTTAVTQREVLIERGTA